MELSELQLGDVVEFRQATGTLAGKGTGTVIGLDPKDPRNPVMLGWNEGNATLKLGHDSFSVPGADYLPDAKAKFASSLWMSLSVIVGKVSAAAPAAKSEKPCKQCGRMNDRIEKKCWWCETANPTS